MPYPGYRLLRVSAHGGFTLIEMLVVLMLLGLLAGLVVPNLIGRTERANEQAAQAEVERISMGVEAYYLDTGRVPRRLEHLVEAPSDAEGWNGPYIQRSTLQDPWNRDYHYEYPGEHARFDLYSSGGDGAPGTEDDITSWD